jgi:hypothetical protein
MPLGPRKNNSNPAGTSLADCPLASITTTEGEAFVKTEEKEALSCCKMGTGGATGSAAGKVAAINGNTDNKNCFIIPGKLQHVGYISSGSQHFFEKKWREKCLQ